MSPKEIPIPLEKTVVINGSTIEVSIAEKKMSDKEKKAYQKFMAQCISESSEKTEKDATMSCAVSFEKMKDKILAESKEDCEDEDEDDEEEDKEEKEDSSNMEESESASKMGGKMQYREKPKTPANSVKILTVEQLRKWELHEKNETREHELRETKEAWRNTVDL